MVLSWFLIQERCPIEFALQPQLIGSIQVPHLHLGTNLPEEKCSCG